MGSFKGTRKKGLFLHTTKVTRYRMKRRSVKTFDMASPNPKKKRLSTPFKSQRFSNKKHSRSNTSTPAKVVKKQRFDRYLDDCQLVHCVESPRKNNKRFKDKTPVKSFRKQCQMQSPEIPFKMPAEIINDLENSTPEDVSETNSKNVLQESLSLASQNSEEVSRDNKFSSLNVSDDILRELQCSEITINQDTDSESANSEQLQRLSALLPFVIKEFVQEGRADFLEHFFSLVKEKKFPFKNIAFLLWSDVLNWFEQDDIKQMRYSPECLQFFWVGRKLFGGRFIRFMSGMKNEEEQLKGSQVFDPCGSRINFACPDERVLRSVNPTGGDLPLTQKPGILESMIKYKAERNDGSKSYVLMLDGKKIKRGTDVDLLGFETGETLQDRLDEKDKNLKCVQDCIDTVTAAQQKTNILDETEKEDVDKIHVKLLGTVQVLSYLSKYLMEMKIKKNLALTKLKDQAGLDSWRKSKYAYAIDLCTTNIWKIDNVLDKIRAVILSICRAGAHLNRVGFLFATSDTVDIRKQDNVKLLKEPDELPTHIDRQDRSVIKQRSKRWYDERKGAKVTGSSIYSAIGCDTLKRQREHFDKVINGIDPPSPNEAQAEAMKHGTDSEIHQIATLSAVIMPFLYPDLVFHEEGFYYVGDVIVSPDGSLREKHGNARYAFEGKAPVDKSYTTTLHGTVPVRYITQTLYELMALNVHATLFMSWTDKSCRLFQIPPSDKVCDQIKQLKNDLSEISKNCIFIGEFPSVKGRVNDNDCSTSDVSSPFLSCTSEERDESTLSYDDLQRHLLLGKETVNEAYELQRIMASQVVVYLLADTDILWKDEEPHAVPVLYFYRGHSLSMDILRKITEKCKQVCRSEGLDIVASAADGEFTSVIVRGRNGNPLTQHQLSKDVWKEAGNLNKIALINALIEGTKEYNVCEKLVTDREHGEVKCIKIVESKSGCVGKVSTPSKGWVELMHLSKNQFNETDRDVKETVIEISEAGQNIIDNAVVDNAEQEGLIDENECSQRSDGPSNDSTIDIRENTTQSSNKRDNIDSKKISNHLLCNILVALKTLNERKWDDTSETEMSELLGSAVTLQKLTVKELQEVTRCLNNQRKQSERLRLSGLKKHEIVNPLSAVIGDNSKIEQRKSNRIRNPPSLKMLARRYMMKRSYPKKVLNIAYCNFVWEAKKSEWKKNARVADTLSVYGVTDTFEPYYVPDESALGDFEVFVYDKTHLGSNLRKCLCLNRVHGISKTAWEKVSLHRPDLLNPTLLEVNDEGKIIDQMKERSARNMVSSDVETCMKKNGDTREAMFCQMIRQGLYEADDEPGIPAVQRCERRLKLIKWLDDGIDFGDFPPKGATIEGLSAILYEGLRSSNEAKLYMYMLSNTGAYNVRSANTLCSESFFSTMQEMDPWGQGILTSQGVEKQISDFTTITALKLKENRSFFIRTKKSSAYPTQTMTSSETRGNSQSVGLPLCTCRKDRFITCIIPRNHFFDTEDRARNKKMKKPFNDPARGDMPVRQQYGYKINETRVLPSKRLGLNLDE